MLKYKDMSVNEVLEIGNVVLVDGMINSVNSKKSRNRNDEEIVKECVEILQRLNEWKMQNGYVKSAKRGKYEDVEISQMSDEDLAGMYESLYSRRCYYRKVDAKKFEEIERRIDEVKAEKTRRKIEALKASL